MQKFYLSTRNERIVGIIFSLFISIALVVLVLALRNDPTIMVLTAIGAALMICILALYVINVGRAACIVGTDPHSLLVTGFRSRTIDLSKATRLETIPVKSGNVEGRSLAFGDADGNIVAIVPTYFTSKQGILADPMAKQLAEALGLEFKANVPAWYYDKEARKAHDLEVQQQEKQEAQERREAKKKLMQIKIRQKMEETRNKKQ